MQRVMGWVTGYPKTTILIVLLVTAGFFVQMKKVRTETNTDAFFPKSHPAILYHYKVEDIFGVRSPMVLGVVDEGPDGIFNPRTLGIIAHLTETLQGLQGIMEDDVDSLSTLKNIEGKGDLLDVRPFMTEVPQTPEAIEALKQAVFRNEIFLGNIVSRDGKAASIFAQYEDGIDKHAMFYTIKEIVDAERKKHPDVQIFFSGRPVMEGLIGVLLKADMGRLFPIVMLVVLVVLFLTFRSVRGVVLPFAVVLASVFWTLGLMGLTGIPFFAITTVMPVILLAMGVADGIHILSAYYDRAYDHPDTPKQQLVMDTMAELWPPVVMTSVTTAIGFSTLGFTSVVPFRAFGFMTAFGILAAMVFSLTVIPAGLTLMSVKVPRAMRKRRKRGAELAHSNLAGRFLFWGGRLIGNHTLAVVGIMVLIVLVSFSGWPRIVVDESLSGNFDKGSEVVYADGILNRYFNGTTPLNVVVETENADDIKDPALLQRIDAMQATIEAVPRVGATTSIAEFLKRMNMEMNEGQQARYVIPDSKELAAQYLLLYSLSGDPDDFEDVVEDEYRMANVRVQLTSDHYYHVKPAIAAVNQAIRDHFADGTVKVNLAGQANNSYTVINMVLQNQIQSVVLAIMAVFLLTSLLFRSFVAGAFCALPITVATIINFGVMGYFGVTLGVITAMTANIGIGVGIDYAIHFVYRYRLLGQSHDDPVTVTEHTMVTTGKAIFFNAVVVAAGFAVLIFSLFPLHKNLGILVALNMSTSFIGAMTVLPALLNWIRPSFVYGQKEIPNVRTQTA